MHDVLELTDRKAEHQNSPTKLVDLEFHMCSADVPDRPNKRGTVQVERNRHGILAVGQQVVQVLVVGDDIPEEIAVRIEYCNTEPQPLRRAEEWDLVLNVVKEGMIANFDQLTELLSHTTNARVRKIHTNRS